MADTKIAYGPLTQIACTLTALASHASNGRESNAVDNNANLFLDALVFVKTKTGAGAGANDQAIYIFVWGCNDTATPVYPDSVTGADAAMSFQVPSQLKLIGVIPANTAATVYKAGPFPVAPAFGGILPIRWGLVIRNYSGMALSGVAGDHVINYRGVFVTIS